MKKFIITLGLALTFGLVQAQVVTATPAVVDTVDQKTWYHADFETTGVYGVNTEKALQFLKEKKRTAFPIIVGVLDSGIDYKHEDLNDNIWVNANEKAGNGKDDDKNGYIDDIHGWNFIGGKDNKNVGEDTLEVTRLYVKYQKMFEAADAKANEKNKSKYSKEYAEYLLVKNKYLEKSAEAKTNYENFNALLDLQVGFDRLSNHFGEEKLTEEILSKYEPQGEEDLKTLYVFGMVPKSEWEGKSMKEFTDELMDQFKEGAKYYGNQVKYHYNTEFDSRHIVGDDYDNVKEKKYGNNDVNGPDSQHGTHVAGIIAAVRDNDKGINGVSGGNNIKIMSVRTVPDGDERDKDVVNAIYYAVDNGAKILNMSFGKTFSPNKEEVWAAFKYASDKDVLLVKAAGNDNENIDTDVHYPSNFNEKGEVVANSLITVGASTINPESLKAVFSNYGKKSVDVFAPGNDIYSTVPDNKYESLSGTSMASPATAGVAALIWSHYPEFKAIDIKKILTESVNKNEQLTDVSVTGGVIDSYKAVQMAEEMYNKL